MYRRWNVGDEKFMGWLGDGVLSCLTVRRCSRCWGLVLILRQLQQTTFLLFFSLFFLFSVFPLGTVGPKEVYYSFARRTGGFSGTEKNLLDDKWS